MTPALILHPEHAALVAAGHRTVEVPALNLTCPRCGGSGWRCRKSIMCHHKQHLRCPDCDGTGCPVALSYGPTTLLLADTTGKGWGILRHTRIVVTADAAGTCEPGCHVIRVGRYVAEARCLQCESRSYRWAVPCDHCDGRPPGSFTIPGPFDQPLLATINLGGA